MPAPKAARVLGNHDRSAHAGWLDTVVPVENVEILASEDGRPTRIALTATVKPGQNVRLRGQDVREGERVLCAGQVLDINARTLLHPGRG